MKKSLISIVCLIAAVLAVTVLRPHVSRAQGGGGVFSVSQAVLDNAAGGNSVTLDSDSLDTTVGLAASQSTTVNLDCGGCTDAVDITAPHGGLVNGSNGATVQPVNGVISFTFQPGTGNGSYTVEMTSGNQTKALSFRVGPEPPLGQPGPDLTFTPAPGE